MSELLRTEALVLVQRALDYLEAHDDIDADIDTAEADLREQILRVTEVAYRAA